MRLYVATSNAGKLRDFAEAARTFAAIEILPLPNLVAIPPPPEDGLTFEANAISKAIAYSLHAPGEFVLADDSGLEADALGGAPGVRSARYAADIHFHPELSQDVRNNLLLLENLRGTEPAQRTARYRAALAAACDGQPIATAEGFVEGRILEAPQGTGGFGYDPLFYLPELDRTMAEIGLEQKLALSHRGHALLALLQNPAFQK